MNIFRSPYFNKTLHVLIWILLLAVPSLIFHEQPVNTGLSKNFFLPASLYNILVFYFIAYFLYPLLITKKRWWLYVPALAVIMIASYYGKLFFLQLDASFIKTEQSSRVIFFSILPFIIGSTLFRLISDRIKFERLEKEARAERLGAELKYLRSQVSPHFLFNMMTNMVSLARQKSDLLEPSLIKLSELLRYMLYDSTNEAISLNKEIEHLENYIALQQLRFGEDVYLEITIKNDCIDCMIEPMLLIPFIENAFKHGIGMVKNPFIKIKLNVVDAELEFIVSNNYNSDNRSKDKNSGIGLMNVKNRLELLYPDKYKLNITDDNQIFSVHLNINLL